MYNDSVVFSSLPPTVIGRVDVINNGAVTGRPRRICSNLSEISSKHYLQLGRPPMAEYYSPPICWAIRAKGRYNRFGADSNGRKPNLW